MNYKFTTIEECQQIINDVNLLLNTAYEKISSIQFPFEEIKENCFSHVNCHKANICIHSTKGWLNEIQEDLNTYKKGKK